MQSLTLECSTINNLNRDMALKEKKKNKKVISKTLISSI